MNPVIFVGPIYRDAHAPYAEADAPYILNHVSRWLIDRSLAICSPELKKDTTTCGIFKEVLPSKSGEFTVDLALELPDVLPVTGPGGTDKIEIQLSTGKVITAWVTDQLARFYVFEEQRGLEFILPICNIDDALSDPRYATCYPRLMGTVIVVRFKERSQTAEQLLDNRLDDMLNEAVDAARQYSICSLAVTPSKARNAHPIYSRGLFECAYLGIAGDSGQPLRGARVWSNPNRMRYSAPEIGENGRITLRSLLKAGEAGDEAALLVSAAESCFTAGMMDFAFLQAFMAAEIAIGSAIHAEAIRRGVSQNALKDVKRDLTISMQINLIMPALFPKESCLSEGARATLNAARKVRNDFVHEGAFDLAHDQVWEVVSASKEAHTWSLGVKRSVKQTTTSDKSG